uniref:Asparaginase n=1 Tax=Candidatus Kentrum sp. TUN TaxID=2126343 RepID=A0A451A7V3_9GAMM|nr:MAG: Asparaginase [Candidatus Kentron sp. TUN]VFK62112.1 MAG: Asparaginase [Candidatus Kentron sp. TUN]
MRYLESIRIILEHSRRMLSDGASAVEVVESCASQLEDDPLFNAGCGSVLNKLGKVESASTIRSARLLDWGYRYRQAG